MTELHASIRNLPMPSRMRSLPLTEAGWPALFFADMVDGKIDLRVMDPRKWRFCVAKRACWLCGQPLGRYLAWPIGPMCVVNRTTQEPPSHRECAEYAVRVCPFLTRPHAHRRTAGLPEDATFAGHGLTRNPGVTALWVGHDYSVFRTGTGPLIHLGDPNEIRWYAQGREATADEVWASLDSGLPLLREVAEQDGPEGVRAMELQVKAAMALLPARLVQ